jgi:hypothetical protein
MYGVLKSFGKGKTHPLCTVTVTQGDRFAKALFNWHFQCTPYPVQVIFNNRDKSLIFCPHYFEPTINQSINQSINQLIKVSNIDIC